MAETLGGSWVETATGVKAGMMPTSASNSVLILGLRPPAPVTKEEEEEEEEVVLVEQLV